MTSRATGRNVGRVEPAKPQVDGTCLPLLASCTFCDDVRLEASGKFCMIGCYPGDVIVANPAHPITQLWLFAKMTWCGDFDATGLRLRVDVVAQGAAYMDVVAHPATGEALARTATCVWQLRLLPLRVGDLIRVSVVKGTATLPCGQLLAVGAVQSTRH